MFLFNIIFENRNLTWNISKKILRNFLFNFTEIAGRIEMFYVKIFCRDQNV